MKTSTIRRRLSVESLEHRRLLAALKFEPVDSLPTIDEDGERIVLVSPGQTFDVTLELIETERLVLGFQANLSNSDASLQLSNYRRGGNFNDLTDDIFDPSSGDFYVVGGSFNDRGAPPAILLGTFTVMVPTDAGDHLLTANRVSDPNNQITDVIATDGGSLSITDFGDLTIRVIETNDVPNLNLFAATSSLLEGDMGGTQFQFDVTRDVVTSGEAVVNYVVEPVGPLTVSPEDFVGGILPNGQVVFADGDTIQSFFIEVRSDLDFEPDEIFQVKLSSVDGDVAIISSVATALIQNDDSVDLTSTILVPQQIVGPFLVSSSPPVQPLPSAVIFEVDAATQLTIRASGSQVITSPVLIVDQQGKLVSSSNGVITSGLLSEGISYAVIFPSSEIDQNYAITVSQVNTEFSFGGSVNFLQPSDTNGDGRVTAIDALQIVNFLSSQASMIPLGQFLDVNRNGEITALDALLVINEIQNAAVGSTRTLEAEIAPTQLQANPNLFQVDKLEPASVAFADLIKDESLLIEFGGPDYETQRLAKFSIMTPERVGVEMLKKQSNSKLVVDLVMASWKLDREDLRENSFALHFGGGSVA
ncbi:Dockerin type I repeat protein [Rubripirellula obstinata]|uniref:Dockerin type I repeat protein n=1 Tax=Rubripirellula obstinata TaxID=406547 RepID=A0A5B1CF83_9BACT|nr:dockerin type I domain-containing protein [Rubripirellula obstinata]KAA1258555.1 Dockerin type I repeat protein [Rubripirellula obstinata]